MQSMLLTMKTIVWNDREKMFTSPQQKHFHWPDNQIIEAGCECAREHGKLGNCHHGIYSSPNIPALDEYAPFGNNILVLLNSYGATKIHLGPDDLPGSYVVISWGVQIVGLVYEKEWMKDLNNRFSAILMATSTFKKNVVAFSKAKEMIDLNWKSMPKPLGFSRYDLEVWRKFRGETYG